VRGGGVRAVDACPARLSGDRSASAALGSILYLRAADDEDEEEEEGLTPAGGPVARAREVTSYDTTCIRHAKTEACILAWLTLCTADTPVLYPP
jgi:hypothetical protein